MHFQSLIIHSELKIKKTYIRKREKYEEISFILFWLIFAHSKKKLLAENKSIKKGSYIAMANLFSNSIGVYNTNQDDFHAFVRCNSFSCKREPSAKISRFLSFIAMK